MNAEIVAIGTELLLGFTVNTDTVTLGRVLAGLGVDCYHQVTVGDNRQRLAQTIRTALARADLVITCGGLGPTVDDITLETISSVTGKRLLLNRSILKRIRSRFARLRIPMPKTNLRQAMIPEGAVVFPNDIGTAPGFLLKLPFTLRQACPEQGRRVCPEGTRRAQGERLSSSVRGSPPQRLADPPRIVAGTRSPRTQLLVALPGPPAELIPMVEKHLIPRLRRYTGKTVIRSRTLKVTGLTESEVDAKVTDLLSLKGKVTVGIYAHPAQVDLRITAKDNSPSAADRRTAEAERKIRRRLGTLIFGANEETLESAVGKLLRRKMLTLAVAESCTGGLVQHRITEVPGSSDYFRGGLIAYADELKESPLGVSPALLKRHGAVSSQVARAMAVGICRLTRSDWGIGITGIAGPTVAAAKGSRTKALRPGGTKKKPVGLVYIALSSPRGTKVVRFQFSGDRSTVKFKASQAALNLIRLHSLE